MDYCYQYNNLDDVWSLHNLYVAFKKIKSKIAWKHSIKKIDARLLLELTELRKSLVKHTYTPKIMCEFDLHERGKIRHIKAPSIRDRIVQRCFNDVVVMPKVSKYLIYDNGASLKNKGIDFARKRCKKHLLEAYKQFGNDFYILTMDFSKFFDNIQHQKAKEMFDKYLTPEESAFFYFLTFKDFKIDVSYMDDIEYQNSLNAIFDSVKYEQEVPLDKRTNEKFLEKSVGIGNQGSQITGLLYPHEIDNYIKIVSGVKFYGRYMDDTYIIAKTKEELKLIYKQIKIICEKLGIFINDKKTHISHNHCTYLKMNYQFNHNGKLIIKPHHDTVKRALRRINIYKRLLDRKIISFIDILHYTKSWMNSFKEYYIEDMMQQYIYKFRQVFPNECKQHYVLFTKQEKQLFHKHIQPDVSLQDVYYNLFLTTKEHSGKSA